MEDWKDQAMNSLQGMERAQPTSDLFNKIKQRVEEDKVPEIELSTFKWASIAAAAIIVISFNAYSIFNLMSSNTVEESANSYSGIVSNFNIYEQ